MVGRRSTPGVQMTPQRFSVRTRITVALLLMVLITYLLLATLILLDQRDESVESIRSHLQAVTAVQLHRVEEFLRHNREQAALVSNREHLRMLLQQQRQGANPVGREQLEKMLREALDAVPDFLQLELISLESKVVATTTPGRAGSSVDSRLWGWVEDRGDDIYVWNDPQQPEQMRLFVPLFYEFRPIGAMMITLSMKRLQHIVVDYSGLGESGETLVVQRRTDGNAHFITPLRFPGHASEGIAISASRIDQPISRALAGQSGFYRNGVDYREVEVFSFVRKVPSVDWAVLVKIDQREALQPYTDLQFNLLLLFLFLLLQGALVALYLSRSISRPIQQLTAEVGKVIQGEMVPVRIDLANVQDQETALLTSAFSEMTTELMQAFQVTPNGMLILDREGKIVRCNSGLEQMFGFERRHMVGGAVEQMIPLALRPAFQRFWESYFDNPWEGAINPETVLFGRHQSGRRFPVELTIAPLETVSRELALVAVVDVTERSQLMRSLQRHQSALEETIRYRTQELRHANERAMVAAETAGIGIWECSLVDGRLFWDTSMYQLYGLSPLVANDLRQQWLRRIDSQQRAAVEEAFDCAIRNRKPFDIEFRVFLQDGSRIWVHGFARPVIGAGGGAERLVGIHQDITAAHVSQEARDNFIANMSHELRTPLTSIIGNCEYLLEEYSELLAPAREALMAIEFAGKSQLALVNDILDMSKIQSDSFVVERIEYDPLELLLRVEEMMSRRVGDAGLAFEVTSSWEGEHWMLGDPQRILQVLINLVGNAVKFTSRGKIRIDFRQQGKWLIWRVEDNGIGMSPEVLDRLFQRFEQADSSTSRRFGGSGLGLYISQNLARLMGGEIDVSSREGHGSVFQLVIPCQVGGRMLRSEQRDDSEGALSQQQRLITGEVLLADNTPALQQLLKRMVEKLGPSVTVVTNGQEAVERVGEQAFDLILMDMQMPVLDGIEATRQLRQRGVEIPIIAVTANVLQRQRYRIEEAGCNDFIPKPIDREELKSKLCAYLDSRC